MMSEERRDALGRVEVTATSVRRTPRQIVLPEVSALGCYTLPSPGPDATPPPQLMTPDRPQVCPGTAEDLEVSSGPRRQRGLGPE